MKTIPEVDNYINSMPEWQRAVCNHVRDLIHQAEPSIGYSESEKGQSVLTKRTELIQLSISNK